jgi:glutathione-regulated potassium-efflux system protein KefB
LLRDEFPLVKVMARAFDRGHAIKLINTGVEYQLREMFESALTFGGEAIKALGASEDEAADVVQGVRDRDRQRFELQLAGEDWRNMGQLLISNAQEQAREGGVSVAEDAAEDAVTKSTRPARPG